MVQKYDVLLKYRYRDRDEVLHLYRKLKQKYYIRPWLDEVDVLPGKITQTEFNKVVSKTKVIAIFIGEDGFTDSQAAEIKGIFEEIPNRGLRLIPVLLGSFEELPENISFLAGLQPIRFRQYDDEIQENESLQLLKASIEDKYHETHKSKPKTEVGTHLAKANALMGDDKKRYQKLITCLEHGNFNQANKETEACLKGLIFKPQSSIMIESGELSEIPCKAFKIIDRLWLHYSDKQHGFSIQRQIYEDHGGLFGYKYIDDQAYSEFAETVGWIRTSTHVFPAANHENQSQEPPRGHFPYWTVFPGRGTLLYRLKVCGI